MASSQKQELDQRRCRRVTPALKSGGHLKSKLVLENGEIHAATLANMSTSGVLVTTEARPPVGAIATVFGNRARVVRLTDTGLALEFLDQAKEKRFVVDG
ncbi:hypothetical protein [Oceanibacterium hippocampi]|uniref:PilZ domain-containing protein n=1 Tax=Oceanibacterium hippocampi TaxID=745714 RepID=A0A1Y5S7V8_9PROT|nr:hypothetical protein [Oceanibacterium hippocampi]SLN33100.1 hypothetical protein OCH7691_01262 [Oceanibacterium hippocampi]